MYKLNIKGEENIAGHKQTSQIQPWCTLPSPSAVLHPGEVRQKIHFLPLQNLKIVLVIKLKGL